MSDLGADGKSLEAQRANRKRKRERSIDLKTMEEIPPEETGKTSRYGRPLRRPAQVKPRTLNRVRAWNTGPSWVDQEQEHSLHANDTVHVFHVHSGVIPEPKNWTQAVTGTEADYWWKAINEEWKGLWEMGTFEWVHESKVPKGKKLLNLLWRFKVKPDRLKARCCVDGSRESSADYDDIFAPVCRHTTLRVLLQKAVH